MTTMRKPRKAALFDLDDILTDQAAAFTAWAAEFADATGIPLPWLMRAETCHAGARHAFTDLKETFKIQRSIASLHADHRQRSAEVVPVRPEVRCAVHQLVDDGWALGVVTTGSPNAQRRKLDVARLIHYFSSFVISGEYGIRKPSEALFQVVLDELGVDGPADGVMTGGCLLAVISGGQRAGLRIVWLANGRTRRGLDTEPTYVAPDVVETSDWLLRNPPPADRPSALSLLGG
ncbi:HAD family hydrolase [Streptomyces griseoluteus]|uniref:HAD family hydrolase n=1 Tax=Streptomyces griseoluteus TaxID=29306 RepID=UPI00367CE817